MNTRRKFIKKSGLGATTLAALPQTAYKLSQGREHDHSTIIEELNATNNPQSMAIAKRITKKVND